MLEQIIEVFVYAFFASEPHNKKMQNTPPPHESAVPHGGSTLATPGGATRPLATLFMMPTKKRTKTTQSAIQAQLVETGMQMMHPANAPSLPSLDTQAKNISNDVKAHNPFCDQDVLQMHATLVAYSMSLGGKAIVEGKTMQRSQRM